MVQKKIIHDVATGETTVVDYTAEEQAAYDDYNSTEKVTARKLEQVRLLQVMVVQVQQALLLVRFYKLLPL
jgi:hypothetical protein